MTANNPETKIAAVKRLLNSYRPDSNTPKILGRFISEFWLPFVIAVAWTMWEQSKTTEPYDWLSKGGVHFFAAGWAFSQWNRIAKQKKSEDGIAKVNENTTSMIKQLHRSTEDFLGSATGGDSFCIIYPMPTFPLDPTSLVVEHVGKYPLYDVNIRLVDLETYRTTGAAGLFSNQFSFDVLIPQHVTMISLKDMPERMKLDEVRSYNIFVTARSGSFRQSLQIQYIDGKLAHATRIVRNEDEVFESRSENFPKGSDGVVDWSKY